jgi:hypothetical protein
MKPSNHSEKALALVLRIVGIMSLTALIPAVMPFAWMKDIHRLLGMGELPEGPIIGYLTRSLSAMYALEGAVVVFVSLDIHRYLPIVRLLAVLTILFGMGMLVLDSTVGMPLMWTATEGPFIIIFGSVVLWLSGRISRDAHVRS